ncbi:L-2-amino-thiazoline-4-carboxylic acid hydrolase [Gemmatimonadota bacterium]
MKDEKAGQMDRRSFLHGAVPACAMTCLALKASMVPACQRGASGDQQEPHRWDVGVDPAPSLRQLERVRISRFLQFSQYLSEQMGREQVLGILRDFQSQSNVGQARRLVDRTGKNDFEAFKAFYDPSLPALARIVTMEIVESTDTVYEWKITECINADPFLRADAADIGYASACFGDYAFAEAFNPAIKLTRDKTIMEGHEYCNHRYTWEAEAAALASSNEVMRSTSVP